MILEQTQSFPLSLPVVVDLDNTLILSDIFKEQILSYLSSSLLSPFVLVGVGLSGPARLKRFLAGRVPLNPASLPFRTKVVDWIKKERASGRRLFLATGEDQRVAEAVAAHLGVFDGVMGSSENINLKGIRKYHAIKDRLKTDKFVYVGDAMADIPIWKKCGYGIMVNPSFLVQRWAGWAGLGCSVWQENRNLARLVWTLLRPSQWCKNLLVFIPVLTSHRYSEWPVLIDSLWMFLAFCFAASAGYVFNDALDIDGDRVHPFNRERPFAKGTLDPFAALFLSPLLLFASFVIVSGLNPRVLYILAAYAGLSFSYSLWAKWIFGLDFLWIVPMYVLRIYGGGAAAGISISGWLSLFSIFLFTSLICLKRYAELRSWPARERMPRRSHKETSPKFIFSFGYGSGILAILVFSFSVLGSRTGFSYSNPVRLFLGAPVLLVWFSRAWMLARHGRISVNIVHFFLRDKWSYLAFLALVGLSIWAV